MTIDENCWCFLALVTKPSYADTCIDKSVWYLSDEDANRLHPDGRDNPIWNHGSAQHERKTAQERCPFLAQ